MGYNKKQSKLIKRTFTPDHDISREIKLVGKEQQQDGNKER